MAAYPHGTLSRYQVGRCRCPQCKAAKNVYARHRDRMIAYGRWQSYVDAEPSRRHVSTLLASGVTLGRVAVLAGLGLSTLQKLMHGTQRSGGKPAARVMVRTERAILAARLNLDDLPDTAWVDAAGTRRRVQALTALGYTLREQAEAVGKLPTNYRTALVRGTVLAKTARLVRDLYKQWSMTPPPQTWVSERTRRYAAKHGWHLPGAWDDDLIDLSDAALAAELRRQAEQWSDLDLGRAHAARWRDGDTTPLTLAASQEFKRRQYRRKTELEEAS